MKRLALAALSLALSWGASATEPLGGEDHWVALHQARAQAAWRGHEEVRGGRIFRRLDADHNGQLTRAEIGHNPQLQRQFRWLDTNHDHQLSRHELQALRRQHWFQEGYRN